MRYHCVQPESCHWLCMLMMFLPAWWQNLKIVIVFSMLTEWGWLVWLLLQLVMSTSCYQFLLNNREMFWSLAGQISVMLIDWGCVIFWSWVLLCCTIVWWCVWIQLILWIFRGCMLKPFKGHLNVSWNQQMNLFVVEIPIQCQPHIFTA